MAVQPGGLVGEIIDRTRKGTEALVASVKAARTEPERAGYLTAGALTAVARLGGRRGVVTPLRRVLSPLLAGAVLRSGIPRGQKTVLLAGVAAGWVGEAEKHRTRSAPSALGIAGVAGQHVAYSALLVQQGAGLSPVSAASRLAVWAGGIGVAAGSRSDTRLLVPAATIAGVCAAATSALAEDRALQDGSVPRRGVDHGANLVLVSEGLTLLRAVGGGEDSLTGRMLDTGTFASAVLGHLLVVDALVRW